MTAPQATAQERGPQLRRAGLALALFSALARLVTTTDNHPGWSLDPLTSPAPQNGMGPAFSLLLAVLPVVGLGLVLIAAQRNRERVPAWTLLLGALALPAIVYHAALGPTASIDNITQLSAWVSATAAGLAAILACRHRAERALTIAACVGVAGPLACRALFQVYVEHPTLVDEFRADRAGFLASHGWTEGSTSALIFERRLSQPDASAWLAMSNVYASIMVGCAVVALSTLAGGIRDRLWTTGERPDLYQFIGLIGAVACSLGGFLIALPAGGSLPKGAAAALLLGMGVLTLYLTLRGTLTLRLPGRLFEFSRDAATSRWFGPALIALTLTMVLVRGLLGESIGELSILFRWFYLQASVDIFAGHPLWGIGPADFQNAYLLAKNPISPEEVASPHSVFFEYLSMLGVFGIPWVLLVGLLASRVGPNAIESEASDTTSNTDVRPLFRWLLLVIGGAAGCHALFELLPMVNAAPIGAESILLIDGLTKLFLYTLTWLGLSAALLVTAGRHPGLVRVGLAASAFALLAHAQIELTPTNTASCAWFFLMLGAAASGPQRENTLLAHRAPLIGVVGAGLVALAMLALVPPVLRWERAMRGTAEDVLTATRLRERAEAISLAVSNGTSLEGDSPERFIADLEADYDRLTGLAVEQTPNGVADAIEDLRYLTLRSAAAVLDTLSRDRFLANPRLAHTAVGLHTRLAAINAAAPDGLTETASIGDALDLAQWAADRWPANPRALRDRANVERQVQSLAPGSDLVTAGFDLDSLHSVFDLDPYNPGLAATIALRSSELNRDAEARIWAETALRLHEARRLDPLSGLNDAQVQTLRELVGSP